MTKVMDHSKIEESANAVHTENVILDSFIKGFKNGGFHKGMKSMMYLRSTLSEDGFTPGDFTKDFNKLLKAFDNYWEVVKGSMEVEELESARRQFCTCMEGLLSDRFGMTMNDELYAKVHDYTL